MEYLQSLKLDNSCGNSSNHFQYDNLDFDVHLPESGSFDPDTEYKLLTCMNNKNNEFVEVMSFKKEDYFSSLFTKYWGSTVLFAEVLTSSFTLMEKYVCEFVHVS